MVAKPTTGTLVNTGHALYTNLLAAYTFNEGSGTTAADSSGHGHDITLDLTALSWVTSTAFTGNALASAATAGATRATVSLTITNPWTVALWLKDAGSDNYGALLVSGTSDGLFFHANHLEFFRSSFDYVNAPSTLSTNTDYALVGSYGSGAGGSGFRYYVNGSLDDTYITAALDLTSACMFNTPSASQTFIGTLDVLYVWSGRLLTGAEISALTADPFEMYVSGAANADKFFFAA